MERLMFSLLYFQKKSSQKNDKDNLMRRVWGYYKRSFFLIAMDCLFLIDQITFFKD